MKDGEGVELKPPGHARVRGRFHRHLSALTMTSDNDNDNDRILQQGTVYGANTNNISRFLLAKCEVCVQKRRDANSTKFPNE